MNKRMTIVYGSTTFNIDDENVQKRVLGSALGHRIQGVTDEAPTKIVKNHYSKRAHSSHKPWTSEDDKVMVEGKKSGIPSKRLSRKLQRSVVAIDTRYWAIKKGVIKSNYNGQTTN